MRFNDLRRGDTSLPLPLERLSTGLGEGVDESEGVEASTDRRRMEGGHLSGDGERTATEVTPSEKSLAASTEVFGNEDEIDCSWPGGGMALF